ncbi:MAG: putative LPS assembly protein LptD [Flavipsychrobacter sp.]
MFILTGNTHAQSKDSTAITNIVRNDSTRLLAIDSNALALDSLAADTTAKDTLASTNKIQALEKRLGIKLSPDALPSVVSSEAADSAVLDMGNNEFYLYGNAKVKHEDLELNAGKIMYNQSANLVTAAPLSDTSVKMKDRPSFTQGSEKFTYDSLKYNFKSKKAIVLNARSQYGQGFVVSGQVKRNPDQSIYGLGNIYTTCSLDTPHFGIRARKIKVIPNKVVASGAANITIEQVPTPFYLPFGLFPIAQGQRSGFILPTYTLDDRIGLGLIGGGYYFKLSDYADLKLMTNLYSKGSWMVSGLTGYRKKYKYNGSLLFSYAINKTGESYEPTAQQTKDFQLQWQHASDPKSRPGTSFNAAVNAGSSTFNQNNSYDANLILQNQFNSNITYSKQFIGKPYSLSVGARHSQNTGSGLVQVTLPTVAFYVSQFNPFQGKNSVGTKWYEKITTEYRFTGENQLSFYDSTFSFDNLAFEDFNNGMKHEIPINATYNLFRFVNLTMGTKYTEYWLTKQSFRYYNNAAEGVDTIKNNGFFTARDFNASIGVNTRIYGMKKFKKGSLRGIRHVLVPSVNYTYTPDFANAPFRYGYQTIINPAAPPTYLSPYEGSVVGTPGFNQFGKFSSAINFGLNNNLQIKVRTKDSTGTKNVTLIDNFTISSSYDIARDSFNWNNIGVVFSTNLLNFININANAIFDPYVFSYAEGRRINKTMVGNGTGIARFSNASVSLSTQLNGKPTESRSNMPAANSPEYQRLMAYGGYNDYADFTIPWNLSFNYSLQLSNTYQAASKKDSIQISTHYLGVAGEITVTERWKLIVSTGYNFNDKKLQMTNIRILRDLHCWQMELATVPFGPRKFYNFTLGVKAQVLQDLKLLRRRNYNEFVN